jgi:hypothetical protein
MQKRVIFYPNCINGLVLGNWGRRISGNTVVCSWSDVLLFWRLIKYFHLHYIGEHITVNPLRESFTRFSTLDFFIKQCLFGPWLSSWNIFDFDVEFACENAAQCGVDTKILKGISHLVAKRGVVTLSRDFWPLVFFHQPILPLRPLGIGLKPFHISLCVAKKINKFPISWVSMTSLKSYAWLS